MEPDPKIIRLDTSKASPALADALVRGARGEARTIVMRDGVPIGAVVTLAEFALFETLMAELAGELDLPRLQAAIAGAAPRS